jgi:putative transposase
MSDDRNDIITLITEARNGGARQSEACKIIGISAKTLQRWLQSDNHQDGRPDAQHEPVNKLTELELQRMLSVSNEPEYVDLPPSKIVPALADKGIYIASEASFYRLLNAKAQLIHRQKSKPTRQIKKPKSLVATTANQLYSWDITYLPTRIKGLFFYLYLVMDIYSRKIVGWQVYQEESSAMAADMMTDICAQEGVERHQVTLHSDNGSPMKGATMLATLQQLGIMPSFSRPSVSNDNPYSESLFRTLKYRPDYPEKPFADLHAARAWVMGFVDWYNNKHLHSSIKFVTPAQRHRGEDVDILAKREALYHKAKSENPKRWSGDIRNWEPVKEVYLNPEKQKLDTEENKAA